MRIRLGGRRNGTVRQSMQSGVVLIGFAYFESYFNEIVEDVFDSFATRGVLNSALPQSCRTQISVSSQLRTWMDTSDPSRQSAQIWSHRAAGAFDALVDDRAVPRNVASHILAGVSYPKLDNVKKLLTRLGITSPLAELRKTARCQVDQFLVSFHDARVDLAHNGTPPGWAESDFERKLTDLEVFARALDRVVFSWVVRVGGRVAWPR